MNILQQIWTDSNVFSILLVNLVHTVALVPVIDHDVVAVGETAQFFAVAVELSDQLVNAAARIGYGLLMITS